MEKSLKEVKLLKDSSGVALILTILIISLIVAITLRFNTTMRSDLHAAINLRDGIRLGCIARSGLNSALAVLFEDMLENSFDSLHEPWAYSKDFSSISASIFEEGFFVVEIMDHSGRIQINQLVDQDGMYNEDQKELLRRFLGSKEFDLDPEAVDDIMDAIKDWIDPDNEVTRFGAENSYYRALEEPYYCKNARMESLEELLLVKGITKELFYGTKEKPGISSNLSIYGTGRININTAEHMVLGALSVTILDQDMADDWVEYRDNEESDLSTHLNYPGMSGMNEDQRITAAGFLTTSSTHFEIRSEGLKDTMRKRVTGMVKRNRQEKTLKILSWKTL